MSHLVSVVIPCFNHGQYLGDAIRSVLSQTHSPVEIIVVDDGSRDNTAEVAQAFDASVKYIYQRNKGLAAARNAGIEAVQGNFLNFLDADDCFYPDKIEKQFRVFERDPSLGLVYCGWDLVRDGDFTLLKREIPRGNHEFLDALLTHSVFHVLCPLVRCEAVKSTGFFDESLTSCEDRDYWLRAAQAGVRFGHVPDSLAWVRVRNSSMNTNIECMYQNSLVVLEKHSSLVAERRALLGKRARIHFRACLHYMRQGNSEAAAVALEKALSDKPDLLEKCSVWESGLVAIADDPFENRVDPAAAQLAYHLLISLAAPLVSRFKARRQAFFGQMSLGRLARRKGNDRGCRRAYWRAAALALRTRVPYSRFREVTSGLLPGASKQVEAPSAPLKNPSQCPPPGMNFTPGTCASFPSAKTARGRSCELILKGNRSES